MAHEITERDQLFVVRRPAWHGLGEVLPGHPTREEAQKLAHPWEPVSEPVYRRVIEMKVHQHDDLCTVYCEITEDPTEFFEPVEDAVLNARSDDGYPLGVVSKTFTPVSNATLYEVAEAIEGGAPGSVLYETGGSLKGGRKVWLLLKLAEPIVIKGDPNGAVLPYYALQNAHDGSGSFRGQATMTRIVCDNTAQMADLDSRARGTEFVFSHTKNVKDRIEEAKEALAGWRESIVAYQEQANYLMELGISDRQRELFLERFIPMPLTSTVSDRVVHNIEDARGLVRAFLDSATCEGISHTAYGLVQATVEYLNHGRRAHSQESLFKRAYLDRSKLVTHAVNLVEQVAVHG